jgi:hypothetical protein
MESLSFGIGSDFGFQSITDYLENKKMEQYYFERIKIKKFKGEYFETFRSYLDENQKTRLKITYAMETPKFTRDDLPPRLLEIGNILGFKLIPYEFEKIDFDMGSVSFLGSILFSPEAVEKIISLSEKDICNSYLNAQEDFENLWRCQDKKYSLSLAAFLKDFDQIKRAKIKLDEKDSKNKIYWYLKNFTDLLSRYGEKRGTVGILKKFLNPSDYFEMAFMLSDREPFPGSTSEILLASPGKNGHYPSIVEIADTNADSFALFSDKIIEAVGPYFYYNYKPKGVNRSEEIMNEIFSKIKFSYR